MPSTPEPDPSSTPELLARIARRLRWLTVAVTLLAGVVLLLAAAVHGSLINYFGGDARFYAVTSLGAALLGGLGGWFAARWR